MDTGKIIGFSTKLERWKREKILAPDNENKSQFYSSVVTSNIAKEVNVSTETIRAEGTNLELEREMNSSKMRRCGQKWKTSPSLTKKSKQWQ